MLSVREWLNNREAPPAKTEAKISAKTEGRLRAQLRVVLEQNSNWVSRSDTSYTLVAHLRAGPRLSVAPFGSARDCQDFLNPH